MSVDRLNGLGIATDLFDLAGLAATYPRFSLDGVGVGALERGAGYADPYAVTEGLFRRAVELGATARLGQTVVGLEASESGAVVICVDGTANIVWPGADRGGAVDGPARGESGAGTAAHRGAACGRHVPLGGSPAGRRARGSDRRLLLPTGGRGPVSGGLGAPGAAGRPGRLRPGDPRGRGAGTGRGGGPASAAPRRIGVPRGMGEPLRREPRLAADDRAGGAQRVRGRREPAGTDSSWRPRSASTSPTWSWARRTSIPRWPSSTRSGSNGGARSRPATGTRASWGEDPSRRWTPSRDCEERTRCTCTRHG